MTTNREISYGINPEDAEALQARCHYLKLSPGNTNATQEFLQAAVQPNPQMWVFAYDLYNSEEFDVLREMNWPDDVDSYQFLHGLPSLPENPLEPYQYWVPSVTNGQNDLTCWHVAFLSHTVEKTLLRFEGEQFVNCSDFISDTLNDTTIVLDSEDTVIDSPARTENECVCD